MRRSAAPSQLLGKLFKRPKFIPPTSNLSPNEEITKLNPDTQLFEVAADNTFFQSQADPRIHSLNLLPAEESGREMSHGDNSKGKDCFETSTLNLHQTVQTWMRKHRLVPVHYR
ncbi:DNA repair and recombination protein RAD54B isoform X5 [Molossus molossus]|uniref:RAD54-like protein B n=1 Tax=Molossus molossus TaxID=27622 RepID=A0A7J8DUP5_MOLMO|nr:DNA repair and recombination protein RAD54B isoform X5 [Molossus molossus]KAF6426765.1 RAD54-like protein B [Molossus molossus]